MNLRIPSHDQGANFMKELAESKSEVSKLKAQKVKLRDVLLKTKVENANLHREISKLKLDKSDRNFKRELAQNKKISLQKIKEIKDLNELIASQNEKIGEKDEKIKELVDLLTIKNDSNEELRIKLDEANFKINENLTIVEFLKGAEMERKNIESVYKANKIKSQLRIDELEQSRNKAEILLQKEVAELLLTITTTNETRTRLNETTNDAVF